VNQVSENDLVCAVDLGGTNLRSANVDRSGRIHELVRTATPETDKAEEIVSAIAAAVRECESNGAKRGAEVHAISIVVPGSVQVKTGLVVNAPNVPSLPGFRLADALQKELGRAVLIENDANAAAVGEQWQGAARGCRTIVCLTLGTGVGGGIVLDGRLWRGADGTAGEVGHMTVEPSGIPCKCGNTGCLEVYASGTAIVRMTREAMALNSESRLRDVPSTELSAEKVYRAAVAGDRLALEVFQTAGRYLGIAMASMINVLNPEMIVVGGGVSAAWDLFGERARDEVLKRAFPAPAQRCQIMRAVCGDTAGLIGAAWLGFGVR
jgi:glucokinase